VAVTTVAASGAHDPDAVRARYEDVDQAYHEQRENRLLGFLLFLVSDVILFSMFIFAYCYLRNSVPNWPPIVEGGKQLPRFDVNFAAFNSVVLFGSGATMHFAMESWKHQNRTGWFRWLIATIVLGIGFLCGQAYEYNSLAISWAGSTMGAAFFTLTGMHGFHVFVGVVFLCVLGFQTRAGVYTDSKYFGLTAGTLYWHFVDVIWVALFFLFYLW
jgi:cytochrome c oxidase subunit 3